MSQDIERATPDPQPSEQDLTGLTREEDDELRRLFFLARFGSLTEEFEERIVELRLRDRRKEIREPRAHEAERVPASVLRMIPPHDRPGSPGAANGRNGPGSTDDADSPSEATPG